MMEHQVRPPAGARHPRKRVGRGDSSGHGSYSGRGIKGQKARSGKGPRPGFEGGQLPLVKALPEKRGFFNLFRTQYAVVNLRSLERFPAGTRVTPETLQAAGLIKDLKQPVKVLGDGELTRGLTVVAHRFSQSAREKIQAAGGTVEELSS